MSSPTEDLRPRSGKMTSINNTDFEPTRRPVTNSPPAIMDKYFVIAVFLTCALSLMVYMSGMYSGKHVDHKLETLKNLDSSGSSSGSKPSPVAAPSQIVQAIPLNQTNLRPVAITLAPTPPTSGTTAVTPVKAYSSPKTEDKEESSETSAKTAPATKPKPAENDETTPSTPATTDPNTDAGTESSENAGTTIKKKKKKKIVDDAESNAQAADADNSPKSKTTSTDSESEDSATSKPKEGEEGEESSLSDEAVPKADKKDDSASEDAIPISKSDSNRRCGEAREGAYARPCANEDKMCGHWEDRYFKPTACHYDDISPEQARECIGSKALAFIGDNHMRDIAYAVAAFLQGETLYTALGEKLEHTHKIENNGTVIPDFSTWPFDSTPNNGYIFPQEKIGKRLGYKWQVQYWAVYRKKTFQEQGLDILRNEMPRAWASLKPISLAFWSHGIHDYGWYNTQPYGEHYYDRIFGPWLNLMPNFTVPCVWTSLNNMCQVKAKQNPGKGVRPDLYEIIDDVNKFMNKKLLDRNIPYWDASQVLRCPERCDVSDDGMHVKMYVDIMRAKCFLIISATRICDGEERSPISCCFYLVAYRYLVHHTVYSHDIDTKG